MRPCRLIARMNALGRRGGLTLAAVLAAACLIAAILAPAGVFADEDRKEEVITIDFAVKDYASELESGDILMDVYRVGDAPAAPGDPWVFTGVYSDYVMDEKMYNEDLEALAQQVGLSVLTQEPIISGAPIEVGRSFDDSGEPLSPGIYLLLVRGSAEEDYTWIEGEGDDARLRGTLARTDEYEYVFAPELLRITEEPLTVYLKVARSEPTGSLRIVKNCLHTDGKSGAIFVFDVKAVKNGETVYTDVVSITWPTRNTATLTRIPAGAKVTVEEVYSGGRYFPVGDRVQTAVISALKDAELTFTNDYDGSGPGGGGIENHFELAADDGGGMRWIWNGEEAP